MLRNLKLMSILALLGGCSAFEDPPDIEGDHISIAREKLEREGFLLVKPEARSGADNNQCSDDEYLVFVESKSPDFQYSAKLSSDCRVGKVESRRNNFEL
jgi:hypothetical protein